MLSDRTRSKYGKYRPWVIFATPFLALNVVLMFSTFDMSSGQKVVYAYVTYILYSLLSTMVNIPYHSLTPVMSEDSNQRTDIASAKQIMAIPANLFVAVGTLPLVNLLGGGASGWQKFAILVAAITVISFWLCAWGAKKHDVIEEAELNSKREKVSFKSQLNIITKNKPLLLLMGAFGVQMLALAAANSVNMYYMMYNVGRPDLVPVIGLVGTLAAVPIAVLLPVFARKVDKKKIFIFGNGLAALSCLWLFVTPITNINSILLASICITAFGQVSGIIGWAMLPDCVDYAKWKLGISGAGTVSSSLTFINKCGMAFGGLIAGAVMSAVGYVAGAEQSATVLSSIAFLKCMVPAIAYTVSAIIIAFYPITNASFKKIIQEIKAREITV